MPNQGERRAPHALPRLSYKPTGQRPLNWKTQIEPVFGSDRCPTFRVRRLLLLHFVGVAKTRGVIRIGEGQNRAGWRRWMGHKLVTEVCFANARAARRTVYESPPPAVAGWRPGERREVRNNSASTLNSSIKDPASILDLLLRLAINALL